MDEERFWSKVNKTDSCWLWIGYINRTGYGQFGIDEAKFLAHRVSWLLSGNTIPEGHVIRHKCRSKNCVNPEHLETGTMADNNRDKKRDGTESIGEKNGSAKLTEAQVLQIRARATEKQRELAREFCISPMVVNYIIRRRIWKHI